MIVIPEAFARSTVEREGEPGADWLAALPGIVETLLDRWGCVPDGDMTHGGVGIVVPVRRAGVGAVLKVSFPHPGNVHEPEAFAVWDGHGAVLLHERADADFAMLLERAHPSTLAEVADGDEVVTTAARISRRLAVPAPHGLPRLRDRAGAWEEQLRKDAGELAHTMPRRVVDAALATVRELGAVQPDTLVHGDLHPGNILRADREPWLAVDPKGYAGDPAYDGGTLLKSRAPTFLGADDPRRAARRVVDVFAEAAGLDRVRVRRWAQLHAVQAAFWGRRHGFRVTRGGAWLDTLTEFADRLAETLTEPARRS
ncbi:aminoglycoside phosphotransferase family protein [Streptantibioticus cattleyicolor]|uniref:Aminoglycoside/hydroxyurea antibiotic resistance kinase n=1 Tax=Streptantibioticus cattleyicolor (strain ATCC 35852 / DSM 46488 / JCM 4925 / NBRC 14057 / NRRL 8057) TaxID=1003195 RepID=F8JLD6_STREN|nr:aminoglycoside phosphotransferase family protein [Streptantibioticus cattleyicolor]AEW99569.1 aminoglycoside/hydroxyurea antibiotic resistance kinase [Streptantibioticus cattleyicolor NRRL 8057 = DSM 46488]CCB71392.1 putative Streptomycin 6-kinase [Streptantibioticus cattleyicolor NRRL 8057 = DSM 46488]